jgi:heptosyltransferase-2
MPARPEKILVRGVNWLGDAVMTTPALQRLREAQPHARIELLTHEKLAGLWQGHSAIDGVIAFADGEPVTRVARRLRSSGFDTALVLPNSPRSALEAFLARIPVRIGYARHWRRFLLTQAVPPRSGATVMHKRSTAEVQRRVREGCVRETFPAGAHHVHDYLGLAARLGGDLAPIAPRLHVAEDEVAAALARLDIVRDRPLVALNPGAEYGPAKRWPAERFVDAAIQIQKAMPCRLLVLGGPGDTELAGAIAHELAGRIPGDAVLNVAGRTSLRELCAVLKASVLLLTNDSGPMHVAAALGTPVVAPFGSTSPELTGPVAVAQSGFHVALGTAACAPCFRRDCPIDFRCMRSISVEEVIALALRCLGRAAA